jgi:hypothetical protein
MRCGNRTTLFDQLDWWERQWRGSFDLQLYLQVCRTKRNEIKTSKDEKEKRKLGGKLVKQVG